MDAGRFDALARSFPSGARRQAVRVLSAVPVAGLLASLAGAGEPARAGKKKKKKKCCQQGPQVPAGAFSKITMRELSAGLIAAGATSTILPKCEDGETPVSAGFACGSKLAHASLLTTNTSGAQIDVYNGDTTPVVCTGNVLCAS